MKNLYKITAFLFFSTIFAFEVNADDWAEKDCDEYEQLMDMSDKARKAEKEEEAEELFEASFALAQMASNHTNVYAQFCD